MEEPLSRIWLLSLMAGIACTGGPVHSGLASRQTDVPSDSLGDQEQPRLILRCEEGRVGAYVVVGTSGELQSGELDDAAVPVRLDSAPSC